ncbi:MAG: sugar transferase [Candidatus Anstonellales archaeon]
MQNSFYIRYGKRIFDFTASLLGLIILSPFLLVIAMLIYLSDGRPVFFKQKRIGKDFISFNFIKFRTMIVNKENSGPLVTQGNDPRITPLGRFLRKTKIDELPQLINVLKGEMSIVGPRPEVEKYVMMFKDEYKEILRVKPGITDYATIEFIDEEAILNQYRDVEEGYIREVLPRKIELYKKYISEISFLTDIKLILKTLLRIVK